MRLVIVVEIEGVDTGRVSAVVGAIREHLERAEVDGVNMTGHVGDAADRIMAAVSLEMGGH